MTDFELAAPASFDLARTLSNWRMGFRDPTLELTESSVRLAMDTPDGPVSLRAERTSAGLRGAATGAGAEWLQPRLAGLFGLEDDPSGFAPTGRVVRDLHRRFAGMHLPRAPRVFGRLVAVVLQQLIPWKDACRSWASLSRRIGRPGDGSLLLPPSAEALRGLTEYELVAAGVRPQQARTLRTIAKHEKKIERAAERGPDELATLLTHVPGIGPWTRQYLAGTALGVADAVLLGDYGLPHAVAYVLAGEERATDERMLELLEPYRGHRFRVIRLVWMNGVDAPRRGPRAERP